MTASIGRNEPCPCGSGKKYKRCHGSSSASDPHPGDARARELKALDERLAGDLLRFARRRHEPDWASDMLDVFGLLEEGGLSPERASIAIPWLLYFAPMVPGETTLANEWRRSRTNLAKDEVLLLDAYDTAWLSLWEVADVERGRGTTLKDMLTHEERFVHDVSSTATLERYDTVLAIVVTCDGVSFFGGVHGHPLPPVEAEIVVGEARSLCRVRTRAVRPEVLRKPDRQLDLIDIWNVAVDEMCGAPLPVFQNTDGDPISATADGFALLAPREEILERLTTMPGAGDPESDGTDTIIVVTRQGNSVHRSWDNTVVGRIIVSARRLIVETNSERRADTLRSRIEAQLDGLVQFRLRREDNMERLVAGPPTTRRADAADALPPEAAQALHELRERYMQEWLDTRIPALGGLTPRDAARRPGARRKLETLIKEIERSEARLPADQQFDLRALRDTLGMGSVVKGENLRRPGGGPQKTR